MKFLIPLFLAALALAFLAGCVTRPGASEHSLLQGVLDKFIAPEWQGDAEFVRTDQYLDWDVKVGNLRKTKDGRWTWDWLVYERKSHFPIFAGMTWNSTGKVRLGSPPTAAK